MPFFDPNVSSRIDNLDRFLDTRLYIIWAGEFRYVEFICVVPFPVLMANGAHRGTRLVTVPHMTFVVIVTMEMYSTVRIINGLF
jgi:hypothetical protein